MNYNIYAIGNIEFVYAACNGITLMFSSQGSNEWLRFAAYAATISIFYKTLKWVLTPTKNDIPSDSILNEEIRTMNDVPVVIAATGIQTTWSQHAI